MKCLLFILTILTVCSCTKNDAKTTAPEAKDSTCLVSSVTIDDGTNPIYTETFFYDADGRLTQIKNGSITEYTYTYSGSRIFIDNPPSDVDTTDLNSHGFITRWTNISTDPGITAPGHFVDTTTVSYTYTDDTVLTASHYHETLGSPGYDETYIFSNGDLAEIDISSEQATTFTYYEDKPVTGGDVDYMNQLMSAGAYAYKNKHLVKSSAHNTSIPNFPEQITNYTYTQDADGKVLTATVVEGTITIHYTFGYACKL